MHNSLIFYRCWENIIFLELIFVPNYARTKFLLVYSNSFCILELLFVEDITVLLFVLKDYLLTIINSIVISFFFSFGLLSYFMIQFSLEDDFYWAFWLLIICLLAITWFLIKKLSCWTFIVRTSKIDFVGDYELSQLNAHR